VSLSLRLGHLCGGVYRVSCMSILSRSCASASGEATNFPRGQRAGLRLSGQCSAESAESESHAHVTRARFHVYARQAQRSEPSRTFVHVGSDGGPSCSGASVARRGVYRVPHRYAYSKTPHRLLEGWRRRLYWHRSKGCRHPPCHRVVRAVGIDHDVDSKLVKRVVTPGGGYAYGCVGRCPPPWQWRSDDGSPR
jgi:hypothetical protein